MHLRQLTIHPEWFPVRDKYPFNLDVIAQTDSIEFTSPVTCFAGENGTGKSTLLEAVTRRCGIHIWGETDRTRYDKNPWETLLYRAVDIEWEDGPVPGSFFASQRFRSFTRMLDEWASADPEMLAYYGGKSLVSQSHGQSLMAYFRNRYRIRGIYFLDEPETALSPRTQVELLSIVREMSDKGHAQFVIATHSPILLACPGADIVSFDTVPASRVRYEDTDHYRIYRDFLADREGFFKRAGL